MTDRTCSIPGCPRKAKTRGWCSAHYNRWLRNGDPGGANPVRTAFKGVSLAARLYSRIDLDPGNLDVCWEWTGLLLSTGYGQIRVDGKPLKTHRVVYERLVGPIGDLHVLHRCDNRKCCNPRHLFLGTHQDNMTDRNAKGRQARVRGEASGNAKLTEADVRAIRADTRTQSAVAADFGVTKSAINQIKLRKTWTHVA